MKPTYEAQIERKGGMNFLKVTISVGDNYWTSNQVMLDNDDPDEAQKEAREKVTAMIGALGLTEEEAET